MGPVESPAVLGIRLYNALRIPAPGSRLKHLVWKRVAGFVLQLGGFVPWVA